MDTPLAWADAELLAFDFETTGVDRFSDVPVSFALVRMREGTVVYETASLIDPGCSIPCEATAVHGITTDRARAEGLPLPAAVAYVAAVLVDASRHGVPVVGMKLDFDLTMLDSHWRRIAGRGLAATGFQGPVVDALVLDRHLDRFRRGRRTLADLCDVYGVGIEQAHDAAADARATLEVVAAMCIRFPELREVALGELHRHQAEWHREWVESFSAWRRTKGLAPLDDGDTAWPIAEEHRWSAPAAAVG